MEVVNEHDRLYLASRRCCVNASLRDVGFSPVECKLCKDMMRQGFFVVVMHCKHSFHVDCFNHHFEEVVDNPQAPDQADGAVARRQPLLCPCSGCSSSLQFQWAQK
ncbi:unnamed protein product [Effrenium voratum]|nr:unnamed protein product [Effrenium voratum]|mmetsp:Transcript_49710/g.118390  ORF Transcript_49710/g.118390 Transcript_49710/m.118390 type:complete len:106 (-) Transcript_49710:85-402(-)